MVWRLSGPPDLDKRWCVFLILVKVLPYEIIYRFVLAGDSGGMNVERYLNHQNNFETHILIYFLFSKHLKYKITIIDKMI